jgi:hypothetical protein
MKFTVFNTVLMHNSAINGPAVGIRKLSQLDRQPISPAHVIENVVMLALLTINDLLMFDELESLYKLIIHIRSHGDPSAIRRIQAFRIVKPRIHNEK